MRSELAPRSRFWCRWLRVTPRREAGRGVAGLRGAERIRRLGELSRRERRLRRLIRALLGRILRSRLGEPEGAGRLVLARRLLLGRGDGLARLVGTEVQRSRTRTVVRLHVVAVSRD